MARQDTYIPYGRGGAGNMRSKSSIRDSWLKITSQPANTHRLSLISSPEDHYASSKSEPRRRSKDSSSWSLSTSTVGEHRSVWARLFRRKTEVEGEVEDGKSEVGSAASRDE